MKVSRTLHQVAGAKVHSQVSYRDVQQGALQFMYATKTDLLTHVARVIEMGCHNESCCNGIQPRPFTQTLIPIRHLHLRVESYSRQGCHLFGCPSALRFLPRTLTLSFCRECLFNTALADRFHPYRIENLVVRLGQPSDWDDHHYDIRSGQAWFKPLVKTHSVVFIVGNPYETPFHNDHIRDMRYNPEDNLHPWLSLLKRSLIDYAMDPDYAKDITIVNIGSVGSETLGLAGEYLDMEPDRLSGGKCERCFTEREFEKILCTEYDRIHSEHSSQVPRASFKFIPFREYIRDFDIEDILSKLDEKYYSVRDDERIGENGKVHRACGKCGHSGEKLESK